MAAALPFVLPVLPLAVPRIGRGFSRIAKKYAPRSVFPVKPVTNTEPFKGKFPERDFSGASLMQVRPIDVSSLAVTDARVRSRSHAPGSTGGPADVNWRII